MKILTKEQILLLHSQLIENFGGSSDIRDEALLDSAINLFGLCGSMCGIR